MMSSSSRWLILAVVPVLTLVHDSFTQAKARTDKAPIATTLCNIVTHCRAFNSKRVSFKATVLSDGFELTVLVDPRCKVGIVPFTSEEVDEHPDIKAFDEALKDTTPTTVGKKQIDAAFVGTFSCNLANPSPTKRRILHIEQVTELNVSPSGPTEKQ
jgi:hypothetical protein